MTEEMSTSLTNASMAEKGEIIKGTVLKVEDKHALVDISAKQDAFLPINEVSSLFIEKVSDVLNEGDQITVKVLSHTEDKLLVSKKAVDSEKSWSELQEKFDSKETFEVVVHDVVKGGLVVDLGVRAFIPASMVESHFVEDFSEYKGKTLSVKIVELDADKGRVILSHRAVTEEEAGNKKQEIIDRLAPGEIIEGKVQRLTDFGAFVDIGGVDGLVHVSQLSHNRVDSPSDVLSEGETVKVKVLSVDRDNDRISLSIKETQPGPWEEASSSIKAGSVIEGTVKRIVTFGAFVEVAPGIEGLVHISEMANRHIGNPSEVVKEGQQVSVKVLEINSNDKRMSLSMKAVQDEKEKANLKENLPKEEKGFSLADMIGDKLKGYK
ncbi:30S ribosomal protein S1 [Fictibacillus phosphorivorans]|uniref:30S ribosomal protein S1 n=1 Tax=Fictibacillus phosphorivorans TaxID=1221500 RepID=A0A165NJ73_9BACL|nr:30S ribosomal protein S1 [Fictibacillus phosphorivorans]KZE66262.1 30S ribosomal protein S1 [Fictibacillus phosphorivorans]